MFPRYRIQISLWLIALMLWAPGGLAQSLDEALEAYKHKNYAKALHLFEAAGDMGNAQAQHNAGYMYRAGQGIKPDFAKAMIWYRRAADQGFAPSQFNLGVMYAEGEGVKPDSETALLWFRKSAAQGFVEAEVKLAEISLANEDFKQAFFWFKKAADAGDPNAMFNVGSFYYKGFGVAKDEAKAIEYYRKASEAGQPGARNVLKQMGADYSTTSPSR